MFFTAASIFICHREEWNWIMFSSVRWPLCQRSICNNFMAVLLRCFTNKATNVSTMVARVVKSGSYSWDHQSCSKCCGNPSSSCWDMLVWTSGVLANLSTDRHCHPQSHVQKLLPQLPYLTIFINLINPGHHQPTACFQFKIETSQLSKFPSIFCTNRSQEIFWIAILEKANKLSAEKNSYKYSYYTHFNSVCLLLDY